MRVWLDPEKVAALNLTASDVVRAIREQNVQVAAGQLGAPTGAERRAVPAPHRHARPPRHRGGVREHRREDGRERPDHAPERRRAHRARREQLLAALAARQPARRRHPHLPAARQQNAIDISNAVRAKMEELKQDFPRGRRLPHRLRPDGVRARLDQRRRRDARRGAAARRARRHAVPADVARVDHPARRRARVARRHARGHAPLRLLAQRAVAVRPRARDRHRRRRRDRRGRERRAQHRARACAPSTPRSRR